MNRRRHRTLTTLERLQERVLQARSAELNELGARRSALDRTEQELERRRKTGLEIRDIEALPYMDHFIRAMRIQTAAISEQRRVLDHHIEIKRDEVREVWSDRKKSRLLIDRIEEGERTAEIRREQDEQDELTIIKSGRS